MKSDAKSLTPTQHLNAIGILLLIVGVAGFGGLQVGKARIQAVAQWPSVSGQMVKSEVSTSAVKAGRVTTIQPIAVTRYSYSVEGKTYEAEFRRVVPMLHRKPEGTPEEIVARYPVGRNVEVYYNPRDPRDAVLVPIADQDVHSFIRVLSLVAPAVALVGLLMAAIASIKLWSERSPQPTWRPEPAALPPQVATPPRHAAQPVVAAAIARAAKPAPPKLAAPTPPRTTHWLVRGIATAFGLLLFFFGSLLAVTSAGIDNPKVNAVTEIVSLAILLGTAIFGAFLVYLGMRRPTTKPVGAI